MRCALRIAFRLLALTAVLLLVLIVFHAWAFDHLDPYRIDYDAPGVDITSEGP